MKVKITKVLAIALACSAVASGCASAMGAKVTTTKVKTQTTSAPACAAAWTATAIYTSGNTASENNINYLANWWTQGNDPATNNGVIGTGQPWTSQGSCGSGTVTPPPVTPPPVTPPPVTPPPVTPPPTTPPAGPFSYSAYKDVGINMNWNTNVASSAVTGTLSPVTSVMPAKLSTLTWAFATGACGSENWGGVTASAFAAANVQAFVNAGKNYIVSTGGAAGSFTCTTDAGFLSFIKTYYSANMVGVDFDIEAGQSQADINNLVQRVVTAQKTYPNMRFSFTIATLGGNVSPSLNVYGVNVMSAIKAYGLTNYYVNLMVMDYGSPAGGNCMLNSSGQCDMGASAIQAAKDLNTQYGVPFTQIELTPMIGGNDSASETFTIANVATVSQFVLANKLAGVHFWSFDRDNDCAPGSASSTCNTYGTAGTLGFTNAFISQLGL
ncbi:glycosyl hydrolase family 18 protein [Glaciimonas soli]|nr:glycosyl hydrolase family 18 protein [Glaciimonas soli]